MPKIGSKGQNFNRPLTVGLDISPLTNANAFRGVGKYTQCLRDALLTDNHVSLQEVTGNDFGAVDIIHYPYFDFYFDTLPLKRDKPTVVTIHDCIPLVFPEKYPAGIKGKLRFVKQKLSLSTVAAVITDSESSKKDIVKYLGVPSSKITVVYLAADEVFKPGPKLKISNCKLTINLPYFLYVGDVNFNKNLPRLLRAFALLVSKYPNTQLSLLLVGKAFETTSLPETRAIISLIADLQITSKITILGFVNTEELVALYQNALAFCGPSLYEGFSLQVLEAMSCGCPVITTKVSSPPEIAGKAGILVDPKSIEDIGLAMEQVLIKEKSRRIMIQEGYVQAGKFNWRTTAQKTVAVYQQALARCQD